MKRTEQEGRDYDLKKRIDSVFPVFRWLPCEICENQFRREWGFSYWYRVEYVCKKCISTKEDAFDYWKKNYEIP